MASERVAWTCRPYREGDETALVALFERAFERPMTTDYWRWKHGGRGQGVPEVWLAVDRDDRPVSHYGGVPRRLWLDGEERTVMVVADAMTEPAQRRRGAFTAVAGRAHEAWREAGVALVLGMPNEQHGSTVEAVGWQRVSSLRWAIRPLRPDLLAGRRTRLVRLPGARLAARAWNGYWDRGAMPSGIVLEALGAGDAGAALERLAAGPGGVGPGGATGDGFMLLRDASWMRHRFLEAPGEPYDIVVAWLEGRPRGCVAYRLRHDGGRAVGAIAELLASDERIADALVREATRRLRDGGAEMVIALAVPGGRDHRALRRRGFLFSWGSFDVHAVLLDPGLSIDALRADGAWKLSGGDFDVI